VIPLALAAASVLTATPIALPGGPIVALDLLGIDRPHHTVWVPAGNTGNVVAIDTLTGKVTAVSGFPTGEPTRRTHPRIGPSAVTIGEGVVWVGNRADQSICAIDIRTHRKGACHTLPGRPDGLAYVASSHEVWSTIPGDLEIAVTGVKAKESKPELIKVDGRPEGYAVDEARGLYFTNLEDKDKTVAIDVKTRKVVSTWADECGAEGPRGMAFDTRRRWLFVACTNGAETLDLDHDGRILSRLEIAPGVDNIDFVPERGLLYIASGKAASLTVAHVDDAGVLTIAATAPTAIGTRVVVADTDGTAYVADGQEGKVLVVKVPPQ
jgi:DNA-binding beta-propeller fold protein YncE